ncbi:MAG: DNA mismatch repair protein MutS [Syntrophus sp. PtaB.Bin001]|nr:MAG: DNA mismatch repair protein MutS [Syntrophus sp. PtaB.Bin001]
MTSSVDMTNLTPAMKQYVEVKALHSDCIVLFRMGDFYEIFFEDAVTASKILDITLTSRNKGKDDSVPLCGFPYHSVSTYIPKLIGKGFKVAICEQVEDPKLAKGVVKREVVRIVTPGLVVDSENLHAKENNYLAAVCPLDGHIGLAFLDISTGEFRISDFRDAQFFEMEIATLEFREMIIPQGIRSEIFFKAFSGKDNPCRIDEFSSDYFDREEALRRLKSYISEETLEDQGLKEYPAVIGAAGAVIRYVEETQKNQLRHINRLQWYSAGNYLVLDETAKRNLELFKTIQDNRNSGSLFHILDETVTAMGGRRLRWWLNYPLVDPERIRERLTAVAEIRENHLLRENLREVLSKVYDMERLAGRIAMGVANGRDLIALKNSLENLPSLKELLADRNSKILSRIYTGIDELPDVYELIKKAVNDSPPVTIREGGLIKEGYDEERDKLFSMTRDGRRWIAALEEKERKRTGISSLKVGYNNVFGFYIEISKANIANVPEDYVRKQTLVNAERYINQELKEYETTVLNAETRCKDREYELFVAVREIAAAEVARMQKTASWLADLDALTSLAEVAEKYNYSCPVVDIEDRIEIEVGRHPVVERMSLQDGFVPNDVLLDTDENRFLVITGPNMAGKSTYIRQVALTVILAQMGSFVPASRARVGVVDRIFTRIGAADSLIRGQSTFMVEMNEVAQILRHATSRSLVILDEVGRGTSTFDGLSIAWAMAEYLHDKKCIGARTLFATHYHQLTELAISEKGFKNYNIAVKEWGDNIIFLRKIVPGGTNRSYGIQVARIAGVPEEVIARAREVLANLETGEIDEAGMPKIARSKKRKGRNKGQLNLFMSERERIVEELSALNVSLVSPQEALNQLLVWQERLKED